MSANIEQEMDSREFQPRFKGLYAVVIFSALTILMRLWWLQIIEGEELRTYSDKNRIKETKIPAPRGLILDREGRILVDNLEGWEASISPQHTKELRKLSEALSPILKISALDIENLVIKGRRMNGPFRPVRVKENLTLDEIREIRQLIPEYPGLSINASIIRYYPLGENGAQLFGYVAEISKREIERLNKKMEGKKVYEQGDSTGKAGLEEMWESTLIGQNGLAFVEVDARGRLAEGRSNSRDILGLADKDAIPGDNLVLTIDKDIQMAAFQAMKRDDIFGDRIGGLVAMKPNGEVLAWVNTPSYDPNNFSRGFTQELWSNLINDPFKPLRNKVIQDHYSPGSTFKPFMALAALQEGVITPNTLVFSPAVIRFGNRPYHDHSKNGYGNISVYQALERSSNVFFYKMGIALGIEKYGKYPRLLGIGDKTGVQLYNEESGLMPSKEWKVRTFGEEWQPGENLSNAIGQGYVLTTALQMAVAYTGIANEGPLYKPYLVWKVTGNEGSVKSEYGPNMIRDASDPNNGQAFISKQNFKTVKEAMRRVANGAGGTARWWKIPGVEMAGKTGTAQVMSFSAERIFDKCELKPIKQRHHAWYIAWAPHDKPEITVAVLAEHACHGNTGAAPVVRDVIQAYFEKYHPDVIAEGKKRMKYAPPKVETPTPEPEEGSATVPEDVPTGGSEEVIE